MRLRAASPAQLLAWGVGALLSLAYLADSLLHAPFYAAWYDQAEYLAAARAWAAGNLDPALHHYPPGYPLLAAPFVRLFPLRPFLLPDLACLLAAYVLFLRLCARLGAGVRGAVPLGAAAFALAALVPPPLALRAWTVPWTTTPCAPLTFLALLAALRHGETRAPRHILVTALAGAGIAAFRPSDAAVVLLTTGAFTAWTLLRARAGTAEWGCAAGAAACGALLALAPAVAAHLAVHGLSPGPYLSGAAGLGFEWRLIPLRWVTVVISPRPLLPEGRGLATVFPWVLPGIAGLLLGLARPGARPAHALAGATAALHWTLYLAFRDLHPPGLWRFHNYHYFAWTLPFLACETLLLLRALLRPSGRGAALAALAATLPLFAWRAELAPVASGRAPTREAGRSLALDPSPAAVRDALLIEAGGDADAIATGPGVLRAGGESFVSLRDFKTYAVPGGLMLVPLRPLPPGPATLTLDGASFPPGAAWIAARQRLVPGLPCLGACASGPELPDAARMPAAMVGGGRP